MISFSYRPFQIGKNLRAKDVRSVYYLLLFLRNLAMGFISATYALFLLSHGLTILQMNLVNTAFMLGNFVFEIPTGVYADFFGRKKSFLVHAVLLSLAGLIYFFSSSFAFFVLPVLLASFSSLFLLAVAPFLVYEIGRGLEKPIKMAFINKYLVSDKRATLISFDSMIGKIAGALGLVFFGFLADRTSFSFTWKISGFILLTLIPIYLQVKKKESF